MDDFEQLYRQYYDRVFFYLLKLSGSRDVAEEITQDTFFKVFSKAGSFRGDCKVDVWIMQIAKNAFYSYCRRKKIAPDEALDGLASDTNIEEELSDKDSAQRIYAILHKMKEPFKEVFWMRTFGELSFAEIGKLHQKTESWARVTYYRAKVMIREELQ